MRATYGRQRSMMSKDSHRARRFVWVMWKMDIFAHDEWCEIEWGLYELGR